MPRTGRPRAAIAGQRCALNLTGAKITKEAIQRGDWVVDPATQVTTVRLDATCTLLASEPRPLAHWTPVHLHLAASHVPGRDRPAPGRADPAGRAGRIQLVLDRPIAALWGDRFVLRDTSARRTIGGGMVLDVRAPRRRRRTPERLAALGALEEDQPAVALGRLLAQPPGWIDFSAFVEDRNLTPPQQEALVERLGLRAAACRRARDRHGGRRLDRPAREAARPPRRPSTASTRTSPGVPAERLRLMTAGAAAGARVRRRPSGPGQGRRRRAGRRLGAAARAHGPSHARGRAALASGRAAAATRALPAAAGARHRRTISACRGSRSGG